MAERVAALIADSIISPLGYNTSDNYDAVKSGHSCLCRYGAEWGVSDPFMAALINHDAIVAECEAEGISGHYTFFEKMAILSIRKALSQCEIDVTSEKTLIIISSTKGNVDLLRHKPDDIAEDQVMLGVSAKAIAANLGNPNQPVVISNACISGLAALLQGRRMLIGGSWDYVVVIGTEVQSRFIVSGFQSLKALSSLPCKPFDVSRDGLNLGEASAAMVLGKSESGWEIVDGAIRNDANHISGPSRTGEGSYKVLRYVLRHTNNEELSFVNVHGTSTLYNDEMESIAIHRAGLDAIPINSLKGYLGHTMGAAGILESILSILACDDKVVLPTRGFNQIGVTYPVIVSSTQLPCEGKAFIKLLSGFGGVNGALLFKRGGQK